MPNNRLASPSRGCVPIWKIPDPPLDLTKIIIQTHQTPDVYNKFFTSRTSCRKHVRFDPCTKYCPYTNTLVQSMNCTSQKPYPGMVEIDGFCPVDTEQSGGWYPISQTHLPELNQINVRNRSNTFLWQDPEFLLFYPDFSLILKKTQI